MREREWWRRIFLKELPFRLELLGMRRGLPKLR